MEDLDIQFHLRLPKELHGKVKQRAKMNGRSINAELIQIIDDAIARPSSASGYRDEADKLAHEQAEEFTEIVVKTLNRLYSGKR
ncbi:Arc family DNA-binding protein [Yersinia enterocolitica]|uniref:Arc family DNA-binding protein n=1 Tax=Yersinia enterocolitica TaxID=630 RepID=UPI001C8E7132|nr:Arc family DNA-binding protein [Yersinia enterocolitica]MBX9486905.1 Arc family DNA-binding protein [Yersinia enterocolitica]MBX9490838.1 Arc family DNA-binding protein [Yersinia enterocolitica]